MELTSDKFFFFSWEQIFLISGASPKQNSFLINGHQDSSPEKRDWDVKRPLGKLCFYLNFFLNGWGKRIGKL